MQDDEIGRMLKNWPAETPPAGLLERVTRRAMAAPQRQDWREQLAWIGEQVFGSGTRELVCRCAALAICVAAGAALGAAGTHHGHMAVTDGVELAMADDFVGINNMGGGL